MSDFTKTLYRALILNSAIVLTAVGIDHSNQWIVLVGGILAGHFVALTQS